MTRRTWALGCAAGTAAAVVLSALAPDPQPEPEPGYRAVASALLVCPEQAATSDWAGITSGLVMPDPPATGTAAMRAIDAESDLVRLPAPGEPVSLLLAGRSAPVVLAAKEGWAPAAAAGVVTRELAGPGAGAASTACQPTRPEWWFTGTGSELGRGSSLVVGNPSAESVRFDVALFARSGPVPAVANKGIDLGPGATVRLRFDVLAPQEALLGVQVRASTGRVVAALRDVALPRRGDPRGVDFIGPSVGPSTRLWVPGIPAGSGGRTLVLVNPGSQFATVRARLLTDKGPADLAGLDTIAVPAGSVVAVPLAEDLDGREATLELTSDLPVTGGVRAEFGDTRRDLAWLAAAPAVAEPNPSAAAVGVAAGRGARTRVSVAAVGSEVRGTLTVMATRTGIGPLLGEDGPLSGRRKGAERGRVLATEVTKARSYDVTVPAGSQRVIAIPRTTRADQVHLVWQSARGSGGAVLSHLTRAAGPLATGYSWWPTLGAVASVPVGEDLAVLDGR